VEEVGKSEPEDKKEKRRVLACRSNFSFPVVLLFLGVGQ